MSEKYGTLRRRRFSKTLLAYIIYTAVLVVLCSVFLIYVANVISEYDTEQPERRMESEISRLKGCLAAGSVQDYMDVSSVYSKFYGKPEDEYIKDYSAFIKSSGELGYSPAAGESVGLDRAYFLTAGGKPFATVRVKGSNERTKLFFFSMADWKVESVEPHPLWLGKELSLYIPEGVVCTVNGTRIEGEPADTSGEAPLYKIKGLPADVEVAYTRPDGSSVGYNTVDGAIVPVVYDYLLTLPRDITVKLGGKTLHGEKNDKGDAVYDVQSMTEPDLRLYDVYGRESVFTPGKEVGIDRITVELPDNYKLAAGEHEYSPEGFTHTPNPDIAELEQYVSDIGLRDIVTYTISAFGKDPVPVRITDNRGNTETFELSPAKRLSITGQSGESEIPAEILSQIDPMEFALAWSDFMTNDETFDNIKKYYKQGSRYYWNAYNWVHGIDHTFTSYHNKPEYTDKATRDFVRYSENCFSARMKMRKSMLLHATGATVYENIDLMVYFVRDGGKWIVAAQHDVLGGVDFE